VSSTMFFKWPRLLALSSWAISLSAATLRLRGQRSRSQPFSPADDTGSRSYTSASLDALPSPRRDLGGIPLFEIDSGLLDQNVWQGQSKANELRMMDDLEPVAPLDRVTQDVSPEVPSVEDMSAPVRTGQRFEGGLVRGPLFVPPYLYPDAFPAVTGSKCLCGPMGTSKAIKTLGGSDTLSQVDHLTGEQVQSLYRAYGKAKVDEFLKKVEAKAAHHYCNCGKNPDGVYRYERAVPVFNSTQYVLEPADASYSAGNYWQPRPKDGIVAPAETLPRKGYPLQAPSDDLPMVQAAAIEDRLDSRFARYLDQVEVRSQECDTVSEECTTACHKGDKVTLLLGSTIVDAYVVSVHIGNALTVQFTPGAVKAHGADSTLACGVEAGCTVFRPCHASDGTGCVEEEDLKKKDFAGNLQITSQCPAGTSLCRTVRQLVGATFARKGGRACKAMS